MRFFRNSQESSVQAVYSERRRRAGVCLAVTALAVSGCSADNGEPMPQKKESVMVIPDFTYLRDGKTCEGGAPRPCVQPIYKAPHIVRPLKRKDFMNKLNIDSTDFTWPKEAYGTYQGDALKVVCQVQGDARSDQGGHTTAVWNVVEIPARDDLIDSTTLDEAEQGVASFGVNRDAQGQVTAVYGFTLSLWTKQPGVRQELGPCTNEQNPQQYPPAS